MRPTMSGKLLCRKLSLFCSAGLALVPTIAVAAEQASFEVSRIVVPATVIHEILPLFTHQGSAAQLLVRRVETDGKRLIEIFPVLADNTVAAQASASLAVDDDVVLMDIGTVSDDGAESIILFNRDSAYRVDPGTGKRTALITFQSMYQRPILDELPAMDLVYDLNGDGLDDFVIPDFDGYRVYLQKPGNRFGDGVLINAPAIMEQDWEENPSYRRANLYRADVNLDGLVDILFWDMDKLQAYYQTATREFSTEAVPYHSPIEFHNEGLSGISFRMGNGKDQSDAQEKLLFKLADLNADGLPDLVTLTVLSKGVLNKTSTYEIYMGVKNGDSQLIFPDQPDSIIQSKGIQFQLKELDFRNDGHTDLVVSSVELGLARILSALITGSISQDLAFYEMGEHSYSEQPGTVQKVTTTFDLGSGAVFYPTVLIIDVTGDQQVDLVVQEGDDAIKIYQGIDSPRLFAKSATKFAVAMPDNPDFVSVGDLNGDGKQDIMIRYGEAEDVLQNRITVLIAK